MCGFVGMVSPEGVGSEIHLALQSIQHRGQDSAGLATMEADGTLLLQLRAEDPSSGAVGQGFFRYTPDHPKYDAKLKHIGGLKPCQEAPVPPWPD